MKRIFAILLCICTLLAILSVTGSAFQTNYTGITVAVGTETLPLPEYPVGGKCESDRYYPLPNGGTVDVYGWQCLGFARYVFYRLFGVVDFYDAGGKGYHSVVSNLPASKITEAYLRGVLGVTVLAGAHIRVGNDNNGHSMVFLSCDDKYVYTYEGNYDYNLGVTVNRRTWDEFVSYCRKKGQILFIHMPDKYPAAVCVDCPGKNYTDMPATDNWAHTPLHFMLEAGLFAGTSETTVSPNMQVSRAMLVTVLWRMEGAPEAEAVNGFADVADTAWYYPAVTWAANETIVSGVGNGRFAPNQTVTREQITVILHRYAERLSPTGNSNIDESILKQYPDGSKVSSWATKDMAWAISVGLISGKLHNSETLLDPSAGAVRAEIAQIIMNFCEK